MFIVVFLTFPGVLTLDAAASGLAPGKVPQKDDGSEDVMDLTLEDLLSVDIISRTEEIVALCRISESVYTVSRPEIQRLGYRSVSECLAHQPGFYVIDRYGAPGPLLGLRGFWSAGGDGVRVFVNDVPQNESLYHSGGVMVDAVPIEAVDRIEIVKGPLVAADHLDEAFCGSVHIYTNEVETKTGRVAVGTDMPLRAGNGGTAGLSTVVSTAVHAGTLQLALNAAVAQWDGPILAYGDIMRLGADASNVPIALPFTGMLSAAAIAGFSGIQAHTDTGGQLNGSAHYFNLHARTKSFSCDFTHKTSRSGILGVIPSLYSSILGNRTDDSMSTVTVSYREAIFKSLVMGVVVNYSRFNRHIHHNWDPNFLKISRPDAPGDFYAGREISGRHLDFKAQLMYPLTRKIGLTAGVFQRYTWDARDEYDYPSLGEPLFQNALLEGARAGEVVREGAFYVQARFDVSSKLEAALGVRVSEMGVTKTGLTFERGVHEPVEGVNRFTGDVAAPALRLLPRFAVTYSPNKHHRFSVKFAQSIRRPSPGALAVQYAAFGDKLKDGVLETAGMTDLQFRYSGDFDRAGLKVDLVLFYYRLNDVNTVPLRLFPYGLERPYWERAADVSHAGVEASLDARLSGRTAFRCGLGYQRGRNHGKRDLFGEPVAVEMDYVPYSPALTAEGALVYAYKRVSVAVAGRYTGRMKPLWVENPLDGVVGDGGGGYVYPYGKIGADTSGYFLVNAHFHLDLKWSKKLLRNLYIDLSVSNLLDARYRYPVYLDRLWAPAGLPGAGRVVRLTVGRTF